MYRTASVTHGAVMHHCRVIRNLTRSAATILRPPAGRNRFEGAPMRILIRITCTGFAIVILTLTTNLAARAQTRINDRFAAVNGIRLHYLIAGKGDPVILLHGYAENSHMWRPLMVQLAKNHLVIAPDLRGFGQSSKPMTGYDKKTMAQDIHALAQSLGYHREIVVGHDIGLMVAYAYAAQYPNEVDRIVLMDAFLPGVGDWTKVWLLRDLWHFHFYGETPLNWSPAARESFSSISGTTSPPTAANPSPKGIAAFTRRLMRSRARCAPGS